MTKELTQEIKEYYWKLAEEKVKNDNNKIAKFIKENNLTSTSTQYDKKSEDYAYIIYDVAKTMWEADGYEEPPSKFVGIKEREKEFTENIFDIINDKFINESQEEIDESFLKLVDKIVGEIK